MTFPHEGLKEGDENVGGWPSASPQAEVILRAPEPCAAEVTLGVGEAPFEEVMVDVHTGSLLSDIYLWVEARSLSAKSGPDC